MMIVKIKKLVDFATMPTKAHDNDAGFDLWATSKTYDGDDNIVYGTGIAFEIPEGYVGLLFARSSNAKKDLLLSNAVGVLDSGYRGEVTFKFKKTYHFGRYHDIDKEYEVSERIGQIIIIPYPKVKFEWADELSSTDRGDGGYGSTGK